ncbi:MAG: hypothetical protein O7E52_03615 [Candidatus Poribacteria bacterium]|nr:hypothetical protein [Candidatus Poribacteria bacterium]
MKYRSVLQSEILVLLMVLRLPVSAHADETTRIEGTLLMLDDRTPHVACVVQAVTPAPDDKTEGGCLR